MPTSCKSAPFGISATRVRSQPSRQAALDVEVIHKIAELELELLNIVHDHYGSDLPIVTPIYIPVQGIGVRKHIPEIRRSPPEPSKPTNIGISRRPHESWHKHGSLDRLAECVVRHRQHATVPIEIILFFEKQTQALLTGDSVNLFSPEAYGRSELGITANKDLIPSQAIPGLDMLLVELHQVKCEEDLIDLSFNMTSIAEFQGRWFLGLWAGRFINHACLPNATFTYDKRPRQHMLRPGIYVQSCSIGTNVVQRGNEVTVDYGSDYFGPENAECRCLTRQHHSNKFSTRPSLEFRANLCARAASPIDVDTSGKCLLDYGGDNGAVSPVIIIEPLSEHSEKPRDVEGNAEIATQRSFTHDYRMCTPFTAVPSATNMSRWQNRSSHYKNDHVQQKKGRRQRNRIAIALLTIPLPLELRRSSIRPLNGEIRRLDWQEKREALNTQQRAQLDIYRAIQREWQKLLKA